VGSLEFVLAAGWESLVGERGRFDAVRAWPIGLRVEGSLLSPPARGLLGSSAMLVTERWSLVKASALGLSLVADDAPFVFIMDSSRATFVSSPIMLMGRWRVGVAIPEMPRLTAEIDPGGSRRLCRLIDFEDCSWAMLKDRFSCHMPSRRTGSVGRR
jgi:hypothetical protein